MQWLGIPMLIVVVACSMTMGSLWSILFVFVALIPYSFFYAKAYVAVATRKSSPPGWTFYAGVVLAQLAFIAALLAYART